MMSIKAGWTSASATALEEFPLVTASPDPVYEV